MRGPRIGRTILQYSDVMWNIKFGRQVTQLSQRICKRPTLALQLSLNLNSPALGLQIQSLGGIGLFYY